MPPVLRCRAALVRTGVIFPFNINKKSFWTKTCGELIGVALRKWIKSNGLRSGEHIWLEILKPYQLFKATKLRV
jgi:hypothetical protein